MHFEEITLEGFGSFREQTTFRLDRPGINILRGKIGSGKTTILSSLFWCLYGDKLKENSSINTWEHLRDESYQGTLVRLNFFIGNRYYSLVRCDSYKGKIDGVNGNNNIFLFDDGNKRVNLGKGKRIQQANLEKLLGYSSDLFKNSIIFGQKLKRIIEESGPKKKKVFEEAFDMMYISNALANVKEEYKEERSTLEKLNDKIDSIRKSLKLNRQLYRSYLRTESMFHENRQKELDRLSGEMLELKEMESKTSSKLAELTLYDEDEIRNRITSAKKKIRQVENGISDFNTHIKIYRKKLDSLKENKCPECSSILNKKDLKKQKRESKLKLKRFEKDIKKLEKVDISKKEAKISKWQERLRDHENFERDSESLAKIRKKIGKVNEEFLKVKDSKQEMNSGNIKANIEQDRKSLKNLKKGRKISRKKIEIKEWLIKDPLSNSGIKAYLLDELISDVNNVLFNYGTILGYTISFDIDMESSAKDFKQSIRLLSGEVVDYNDLSGGQKQLVDTSVALAIHETIVNLKPVNIMFMDEPFESLDKDSVEIVSELLKSKPSDKSIFIVTHHADFSPLNSNEIKVQLDSDKVSYII